jgi:hypothetical protein
MSVRHLVDQPRSELASSHYTDPIAEALAQPIIEPRWFALLSLFSLFSLAAIPTDDPTWLGFLSFLGFLAFMQRGNAGSRSAGRR